MENTANEMEKDDIVNPEQFQVGRAPQEEKELDNQDVQNEAEEVGYTEGEVQFADGEGTQLDEEIDAQETDTPAGRPAEDIDELAD